MRMPMMMRMFAGWPSHLFDRNHAALQFSTDGVLKLDGGVRNLKMLLEHMVELFQNAGAL